MAYTITDDEKKLLGRFRIMMTESGAFPMDISDAELLSKVKGKTQEQKMRSIENVLSLTPEIYWRQRGM